MPEGLQQIIAACIKGERPAQAKLYELYARKLMGICMWYARNKPEAEEILQDGFMLIFKNIQQYRGDGCFEGWMKRIVINAALAKHRSLKTNIMRAVVEYNANEHDTSFSGSAISLIEEKELLMMVQSLSPVYRMVFNLYVFEGLKHKEIAALLNISEGTSKSNLADARLILQKKITSQQIRIAK